MENTAPDTNENGIQLTFTDKVNNNADKLMFPLYVSSESQRANTFLSINDLVKLIKNPSVGDKADAKLITPFYNQRKLKKHAVESNFNAIIIDHDHDDLTKQMLTNIYEPYGVNYLAFTSSYHMQKNEKKPDAPIGNRWKVFIPLLEPIDCDLYAILASGITKHLGTDTSQSRVQQGFYAPNKLQDTAAYDYVINLDKAFLDARSEFEPFVDDAVSAFEEMENAKFEKAQQAKAKPKKDNPTDSKIIEMVNNSYCVKTILEHHGYKKKGNKYLSPQSESNIAGVVVFDETNTVYSHHSASDPLSNENHDGHSLDVFNLLTILEYDNDVKKAVRDEAQKLDHDGNKQRQREYMEKKNTPTLPPSFNLSQFSLNGQSGAMKMQMLDDVYVLGNMAILGQLTAFYAKPNSGKTLITLHLIIEAVKNERIDGENVFYVNADDNHKGLTEKLELAEKYNIQMIAPGYKEFDPQAFTQYLSFLAEHDQAKGKIIILDTLKKFTNIMDKNIASDFGKQMRMFSAKGGSIIMLAHANKNRDNDGKIIFSGTSDIVDDVDCAYTIDVSDNISADNNKSVVFENIKSRGDVAQTAVYQYQANASSYDELLDSVTEVNDKDAQLAKSRVIIQNQLNTNKEMIDVILELISDGVTLKTDLIDRASKESGFSKRKIRNTLDAHNGKYYVDGHRWSEYKGDKAQKLYQITPDPHTIENMENIKN